MAPETTSTGRARRPVILGFVAFGTFWGAWGAVLPAVRVAARVDEAQLGVALLMIGLGALGSMRLTGRFVDRTGPRVQPAVMILFAVAGLLPGLAGSPAALTVALLLVGTAAGATDVAINAAGVSVEQRTGAPVMNLAHAWFSGSVVLGSLAAAGMLALGASGAVALTVCVAGVGLLAVAVAVDPASRGGADPRPPEPQAAGRRRWVGVPWPLLVLGLLGTLAYLVENAWQSWGAVYLDATLHSPLATLAPALFATAAAVGRAAGNVLARHVEASWMLLGGAAIGAVGTATAAVAPVAWLGFVGVALAGLGTSVCAPTIISITGRWAGPRHRGAAVSTVTTIAYAGFVLGPAAVGITAAATSLRTALTAVAAVALVLAVSTPAVRRAVARPAPWPIDAPAPDGPSVDRRS